MRDKLLQNNDNKMSNQINYPTIRENIYIEIEQLKIKNATRIGESFHFIFSN